MAKQYEVLIDDEWIVVDEWNIRTIEIPSDNFFRVALVKIENDLEYRVYSCPKKDVSKFNTDHINEFYRWVSEWQEVKF